MDMKRQYLILLGALLLFGCSPKHSGFISIFDGTSFSGWEGPKEFMRIEDEAIVAGSASKSIPINQFLCTEKEYEDFELRLQVKFTSTENNAGIQFRTKRIPDHHEVIGYQADVGFLPDRPLWGALYDESRRNTFLKEPPSSLILDVLNPDGWNDYRIRCEGNRIHFWINKENVLSYVEEDSSIDSKGHVCLQIHSGKPAEAWYRNIRVIEL